MKILIVGAGAIGGYFGGRLLEKGADVTFLVREKRHKQLKENGLAVSSIHGDLHFPDPQTIGAESQAELFDVILVSTKSYHLDGAIESIRPFVGDSTMILPLLNGIAHLDALTEAFGAEKVIGGLCFIETTLDESGKVIQTSPIQDLVFGELNDKRSERILKLQAAFDDTKANFRLSEKIEQEMWQKYLFITSLSGITSLFRSPIGPIRDQTQGAETIKRLLYETVEIMTAIGAPLSEGAKDATWNRLNEIGHGMKSSLQRDMEKSLPTEGDHLFGYLLKKAAELRIDAPTLSAVYANVDIYDSLLSS
ncbi:ketopantoate reductase family protein [Mesobacillus sp. AQ2]|jgi:2-dehydropantoate 2-reductase|uniref:ketopantoate reductase family protein n=1 Tax=Bacillaceae TaxID=186817 RepID=UPI0011A7183B|nr:MULTISPECIES: ketopantoate reductase family protein [Bacillaceae]WHX41587.1 ketopantoate reductase family protein [Mesobacillus sp. AQ2]